MNKVIFWGTPDFALPSLQALLAKKIVSAVVTQADKPAGRNKALAISPVKELAQANNIPVLSPLKLNDEFILELKKYLPATFVVVAYGKIIPQRILDLSEFKSINVHPSKLPILRGPSPIQSALALGLSSTAVTLMQLDEQMDHGPILVQKEIAIEPSDDYPTLSGKLSDLGAKILADNIENYLQGKIRPIPQDEKLATYCKLLTKEDGQINWDDNAQNIVNKIKAFNPWPGSFCKADKLDLKIFSAQLSDQQLSPGQWQIYQNKLLVGTGSGAIEIIQIQPAGKKILSAEEFIRGYAKYLTK